MSQMKTLIFLCLIISQPFNIPAKTIEIDELELNHLYDDEGDIVFDQFIYWNYYHEYKYPIYSYIIKWREIDGIKKWNFKQQNKRYCPDFTFKIPIKKDAHSVILPYEYHGVKTPIQIIFKSFKETHTQYDPEREVRNMLDYKLEGFRLQPSDFIGSIGQ